MTMRRGRGFTLIELMIAVAIIGILASVAYPSYQQYVRKGKRTDAKTALLDVHMRQEKWRASNATYGTLAAIGAPTTSPDGYYTLAISSNDANGFVATATGTGNQASDTQGSQSCATLTLTVSATNPAGSKTPATCWQ